MTSHIDFATKLRLTAAALGCATNKDLCARFHAANPRTQCDLDRLHKWVQGRALPRSVQVYDDWARVLGTQRTGGWLATCSIESFLEEISALTGIAVGEIRMRGTPRERRIVPAHRAGIVGGDAAMVGDFACYSPSWSPHYRGKFIRASLRIQVGSKSVLNATYSEMLLGAVVRMPGEIMLGGRTVHLAVHDPASQLPIFFSLILPGSPISVLCGVMSGAAFLASEGLPSTGRVVMIRVPEQTTFLEQSNRYIDPDAATVARDLHALGFPAPIPLDVGDLVAEYLGESPDQVTPRDQGRFAALLDPLNLGQPLEGDIARRERVKLVHVVDRQ